MTKAKKTYQFIIISGYNLRNTDALREACVDVCNIRRLGEYWSVLISSYIDVHLGFTL